MSSRPGVVVQATVEADGGESPNRYRPAVTAEFRVFWPPKATPAQIREAMEQAFIRAVHSVHIRRSEDDYNTQAYRRAVAEAAAHPGPGVPAEPGHEGL